jgi:hypothetical protein
MLATTEIITPPHKPSRGHRRTPSSNSMDIYAQIMETPLKETKPIETKPTIQTHIATPSPSSSASSLTESDYEISTPDCENLSPQHYPEFHRLQIDYQYLVHQNKQLDQEVKYAKMTIAALKTIIQQKDDDINSLKQSRFSVSAKVGATCPVITASIANDILSPEDEEEDPFNSSNVTNNIYQRKLISSAKPLKVTNNEEDLTPSSNHPATAVLTVPGGKKSFKDSIKSKISGRKSFWGKN